MGNAKAAKHAKKTSWDFLLCAFCVLCVPCSSRAQDEPPAAPRTTRLAVLQAEHRRAQTPRGLAILRSGVHGGDANGLRVAARAIGRLERPALISGNALRSE